MRGVKQAIVVEGKYDSAHLREIFDALVVTTDGFNIYKDKEKQALIKRLAHTVGIVVLTDSDDAGFKIRKFVSDIAAGGDVRHAYIPEVTGKERRKAKAGAAHLLGVEGIDPKTVKECVESCLERVETDEEPLTVQDLFADKLNGCADSAARRKRLCELADIPTRLSTKQLLSLLQRLYGREGYRRLVEKLNSD